MFGRTARAVLAIAAFSPAVASQAQVGAAVRVAGDARRAPMGRGFTPDGRVPRGAPLAGRTHVEVGADACFNPNDDFPAGGNYPSSGNCMPGARRMVLGTTPASVAANTAGVAFTFTPIVPFVAHYIVIGSSIAQNFEISSIKSGLCDLIVGGVTGGEAFTENGNSCRIVDGTRLYPAVPLTITVNNIGNAAVRFSATIYGSALPC